VDAWRTRRRNARTFEERMSVVVSWGQAAGAKVDAGSGDVRLELPEGLPNCLALVELRGLAREMRVLPP
jgi:hypothetical protein